MEIVYGNIEILGCVIDAVAYLDGKKVEIVGIEIQRIFEIGCRFETNNAGSINFEKRLIGAPADGIDKRPRFLVDSADGRYEGMVFIYI